MKKVLIDLWWKIEGVHISFQTKEVLERSIFKDNWRFRKIKDKWYARRR